MIVPPTASATTSLNVRDAQPEARRGGAIDFDIDIAPCRDTL